MRAAEEKAILDAIENDISDSTTYTAVDTESTGVDVVNTGFFLKSQEWALIPQ